MQVTLDLAEAGRGTIQAEGSRKKMVFSFWIETYKCNVDIFFS